MPRQTLLSIPRKKILTLSWKRSSPEATCQVCHPGVENRVCEEIGASTDELPLEVPAVDTTRTRPLEVRPGLIAVSRSSHDVQVIRLLQPGIIVSDSDSCLSEGVTHLMNCGMNLGWKSVSKYNCVGEQKSVLPLT